MDRRHAILTGAGASAGLLAATKKMSAQKPASIQLDTVLEGATFVATWPFGLASCQKSLDVLKQRSNLRDAVELGIHVTELDESNNSVGVGGLPNSEGVVQLDACFMDGETQKAGAVCAIEGYANPISVARRVMEQTDHVMLAGKDAAKFAKAQGFTQTELLTPAAKKAWLAWKAGQKKKLSVEQSHDTIALVGLQPGSGDEPSQMVGGCSTSGRAYKLPGRVGDSPILGSGLYVDGSVGGAGATGIGENVMRYCCSFLIVEFMRSGDTPTNACEKAIRRVMKGDGAAAEDLAINFVALRSDGMIGAAGTNATFAMAVANQTTQGILKPRLVR